MLEPRTCLRCGFFASAGRLTVRWGWALGRALSASLPCLLLWDHTGALWSTPAGCAPTGLAFAVGPSWPGVGTGLHFSGTQRGARWTGGASADERQDIGVLQLSSLWWGTEGRAGKELSQGHTASLVRAGNGILITPKLWLFPPQSPAD